MPSYAVWRRHRRRGVKCCEGYECTVETACYYYHSVRIPPSTGAVCRLAGVADEGPSGTALHADLAEQRSAAHLFPERARLGVRQRWGVR